MDGRESRGVADGTQRGDGGLATAGVAVGLGYLGQGGHGWPVAALPEEPGGAHHDQRVGIGEGLRQGSRQHGAGSFATDRGCGIDGAAADGRMVPGQGPHHQGHLEAAHPLQGAHSGHLHGSVGIFEPAPGQHLVPAVPSCRDAAAPQPGALVPRLIRGRIVAHRLRVCLTLTRAPTGRRHRPPPATRKPPGPTRGSDPPRP